MSQKVLPSQVRGQRISYADLVKNSRATLADLCVNNFLRADLDSELAQAVVADEQPILCQQQQPKVRPVQTADVKFPEFSSQAATLIRPSSGRSRLYRSLRGALARAEDGRARRASASGTATRAWEQSAPRTSGWRDADAETKEDEGRKTTGEIEGVGAHGEGRRREGTAGCGRGR
jgi:hypothetical protein